MLFQFVNDKMHFSISKVDFIVELLAKFANN